MIVLTGFVVDVAFFAMRGLRDRAQSSDLDEILPGEVLFDKLLALAGFHQPDAFGIRLGNLDSLPRHPLEDDADRHGDDEGPAGANEDHPDAFSAADVVWRSESGEGKHRAPEDDRINHRRREHVSDGTARGHSL